MAGRPLVPTDTVVPMSLSGLARPRCSRESVVLAGDDANLGHTGVAAALELDTTERDLEVGPPIPSPIESDDSGEDNGHPTRQR